MQKPVLLLNMGGAKNLADARVFMKKMFNDPCILPIKSDFWRSVVARFIISMRLKGAEDDYKAIGGSSPLNPITERLCTRLNEISCMDDGNEFVFDYAMNYTSPFTEEVLSRYRSADEIIVMPLYPHQSITTVTSSLNSFREAYDNLSLKAKVHIVKPFYAETEYNDIIVREIARQSADIDTNKVSLIFSAHSLPQRVVDCGDRYVSDIEAQVEILKRKLSDEGLNFREILLAYQSRLGPIKWLEPNLNKILPTLTSRRALVYPISFCIDNSETHYALSMESATVAREHGYDFFRVCTCPNDKADFVNFIIDMARCCR